MCKGASFCWRHGPGWILAQKVETESWEGKVADRGSHFTPYSLPVSIGVYSGQELVLKGVVLHCSLQIVMSAASG